MSNDAALDTTFRQCAHGWPKCERCENKKVIEWIRVDEHFPIDGDNLLLTDGEQFALGWFNHGRKEFIQVNTWTNLSKTVTHWADISRLSPKI